MDPVPHDPPAAGSFDPATVRRLVPRLAELESDLAAIRAGLQGALDGVVGDAHPADAQLQAALREQRTRANDLEKILYSTNVATIALDLELRIRFFTPATRAVFAITAADIGHPLAELASLPADSSLVADARAVLANQVAQEREVQATDGAWFRRQIMPYCDADERVGGVVITFNNITKRKLVAVALEEAKRQAEQANMGKSRFLAAASHDLRQPLQTLALLHGLLAKTVHGARAQRLVARVDDMLGAMSGMLDRLRDINEIETGTVDPKMAHFELNALLGRMRAEFSEPARAKGLDLRVLPCSLHVPQRSRLAGTDHSQPAVQCGEVHHPRQNPARLPPARRCGEHRSLGYRHGHSQSGIVGDLRGVPPTRQPGPRTQPRAWFGVVHRQSAGDPAGTPGQRPVGAGQGIRIQRRNRPGGRFSHSFTASLTRRRAPRRPGADRSWPSRTTRTCANSSAWSWKAKATAP